MSVPDADGTAVSVSSSNGYCIMTCCICTSGGVQLKMSLLIIVLMSVPIVRYATGFSVNAGVNDNHTDGTDVCVGEHIAVIVSFSNNDRVSVNSGPVSIPM